MKLDLSLYNTEMEVTQRDDFLSCGYNEVSWAILNNFWQVGDSNFKPMQCAFVKCLPSLIMLFNFLIFKM